MEYKDGIICWSWNGFVKANESDRSHLSVLGVINCLGEEGEFDIFKLMKI